MSFQTTHMPTLERFQDYVATYHCTVVTAFSVREMGGFHFMVGLPLKIMLVIPKDAETF